MIAKMSAIAVAFAAGSTVFAGGPTQVVPNGFENTVGTTSFTSP
jgi:hypothetical protein